MKYLVLCFHFLFAINSVYSELNVGAPESIKLERNHPLKIQCNVSDSSDLSKVTVEWKKDNSPVDTARAHDGKKVDASSGVFYLDIKSASDRDIGNYTCSFKDNAGNSQEKMIIVTGHTIVKVPANINVVEGEKLRIHCQVAGGGAAPSLEWSFTADGSENETSILSDERHTLEEDEHKIPNSVLIVKNITMDDRGHFKCKTSDNSVFSETMVRVKDKYAALWPFLGIVAEVVILCAIIFVYEKKHNKAELDESDTDQSPDQKNTPDHGKDGLRHRQ